MKVVQTLACEAVKYLVNVNEDSHQSACGGQNTDIYIQARKHLH